eukprot:4030831-Amphidinium_carterae.2
MFTVYKPNTIRIALSVLTALNAGSQRMLPMVKTSIVEQSLSRAGLFFRCFLKLLVLLDSQPLRSTPFAQNPKVQLGSHRQGCNVQGCSEAKLV